MLSLWSLVSLSPPRVSALHSLFLSCFLSLVSAASHFSLVIFSPAPTPVNRLVHFARIFTLPAFVFRYLFVLVWGLFLLSVLFGPFHILFWSLPVFLNSDSGFTFLYLYLLVWTAYPVLNSACFTTMHLMSPVIPVCWILTSACLDLSDIIIYFIIFINRFGACHNKNVSLNIVNEQWTTATMHLVIVFTQSANADAHILQLWTHLSLCGTFLIWFWQPHQNSLYIYLSVE